METCRRRLLARRTSNLKVGAAKSYRSHDGVLPAAIGVPGGIVCRDGSHPSLRRAQLVRIVDVGNIHSTSLGQNLRACSDGCAGNGAGHRSVATTNRRTENRSQQGAAADVARGFAVRAEAAVANSMPPPDIAARVASTPYRRSLIVIEYGVYCSGPQPGHGWKDLHSTHPENSGETRRAVKAYGRMDIQ
jgi:hypothetical protein